MRASITLTLGCLWLTAQAQQLQVTAGTEDPMALHFDPAFIARNRVKSISGQAQVKRENEPMRPRSERTLYLFSSGGQASYSNTSFGRPGSGVDTASVTYTYDTAGRLRELLRNDPNGFYTLRYEHDAEGHVVRETYARIGNDGPDRYHFVPGTRTTISDEQYRYRTLNDSTSVRTFLNDNGLPYREQTFQKDRLGYLCKVQDHFLVSGRHGSISFRYDEKGRLHERIEQSGSETPAVRHVWTYDRGGSPLSCDRFQGDRRVEHIEYLYEEHTMLLKAVLTQDLITGMIHVMKYTTERHAP